MASGTPCILTVITLVHWFSRDEYLFTSLRSHAVRDIEFLY